ncbi:acyltransferase family protein [Microbacterium lacticum]
MNFLRFVDIDSRRPFLITTVYEKCHTPTIESIAAFGIFIPVILAPQSWIGRVLNWRPIAWLGLISYSLYLTHRWLLIAGEEWIGGVPGALAGIAAAILLSWALRAWVEKPFERLRKRISRVGEDPGEPDRAAHGGGKPATAF